jgi:AraC family transcriptional regulator
MAHYFVDVHSEEEKYRNIENVIKYLTRIEISDTTKLSGNISVVTIKTKKYAVVPHHEHVSKLRETLDAIDKWLPGSGLEAACGSAETPSFFERYFEEFDPRTGMGGMEVWIPIKS